MKVYGVRLAMPAYVVMHWHTPEGCIESAPCSFYGPAPNTPEGFDLRPYMRVPEEEMKRLGSVVEESVLLGDFTEEEMRAMAGVSQ